MMQRFRISTFVLAVIGLVAVMGTSTARAQVTYKYDTGVFAEVFNNSETTEYEDNLVGNYFSVVAGGTRLLSFEYVVGRAVPPLAPVSLVIYVPVDGVLTRIHTTEALITGADGATLVLPLDTPVDLNEGDDFLAAMMIPNVGPGDVMFPFSNDTSNPIGLSFFDVGACQGCPYNLDDLSNLTVLGDTHPIVGAGVQNAGNVAIRVRATTTP